MYKSFFMIGSDVLYATFSMTPMEQILCASKIIIHLLPWYVIHVVQMLCLNNPAL